MIRRSTWSWRGGRCACAAKWGAGCRQSPPPPRPAQAAAFNAAAGAEYFPRPEPLLSAAPRVMSLREPASKMSKSDPSAASRIAIDDPPDVVARAARAAMRTPARGLSRCAQAKRIRRAVTDGIGEIYYDPEGRPGVSNLLRLAAVLGGCTPEEVAQQHRGSDTLQLKEAVAAAVIEHLAPIQAEMGRLRADRGAPPPAAVAHAPKALTPGRLQGTSRLSSTRGASGRPRGQRRRWSVPRPCWGWGR